MAKKKKSMEFLKPDAPFVVIVGIVISVVSLVYTWMSNREQNRKISIMERPRIAPTTTGTFAVAEITPEEGKKIDWGYPVLAKERFNDYVLSEKARVYTALAIFDPITNKRTTSRRLLTMHDAEREAEKLGLTNFVVRVVFQFETGFRNFGQSDAENVSFDYTCITDGKERVLDARPIERFVAGSDITVGRELFFDLPQGMPEVLELVCKISYDYKSGREGPFEFRWRYIQSGSGGWDLLTQGASSR